MESLDSLDLARHLRDILEECCEDYLRNLEEVRWSRSAFLGVCTGLQTSARLSPITLPRHALHAPGPVQAGKEGDSEAV